MDAAVKDEEMDSAEADELASHRAKPRRTLEDPASPSVTSPHAMIPPRTIKDQPAVEEDELMEEDEPPRYQVASGLFKDPSTLREEFKRKTADAVRRAA